MNARQARASRPGSPPASGRSASCCGCPARSSSRWSRWPASTSCCSTASTGRPTSSSCAATSRRRRLHGVPVLVRVGSAEPALVLRAHRRRRGGRRRPARRHPGAGRRAGRLGALPAARAPRLRDVRAGGPLRARRPARAPGADAGRDAGVRHDRVARRACARPRRSPPTEGLDGIMVGVADLAAVDARPTTRRTPSRSGTCTRCWPTRASSGWTSSGSLTAAREVLRRRRPARRLQPHRDRDGPPRPSCREAHPALRAGRPG